MNERTPIRLPSDLFRQVVELTPLVSIDLVVRNLDGAMLLGARENRPAQGSWFVPGGRIGKNERIEKGFARITDTELGRALPFHEARFLGVFEHLYEDNFAGAPDFGTHYVVLAYSIECDAASLYLPQEQHSAYRWMRDEEVLRRADVHAYTKAYVGR